jgi:nucleoside-diphosphate-sugar epimerase
VLTGQRIVMTGMTGQVGGSLATQLAPANEIFGLARYTAAGSREAVAAMGVTPIVCDYTNGDFSGVPDNVDYVIHVAADTNPPSIDEGIRQNAEGTGLLLQHCRAAKGWFYTSTTGVYWDHPDPYYAYQETDRCGGSTRVTSRFHYGTSKFAGEAVARAMSRIHGVPLVIARLNWSYGAVSHGGLPGIMIDMITAGTPIEVHEDWAFMGSPIHEDDLVGCIGPFLDAATIGGTVINWAGDDAISNVDLATYIGEVLGIEPTFVNVRTATAYPRVTDNTRRREVYGPCKVKWHEGIRRIIAERRPAPTST